jgi:hypothetical protein
MCRTAHSAGNWVKDGDGKLAEKPTASGNGHVCTAFGCANAPHARARACVARLQNDGRRLDGTDKNTAAFDVLLAGVVVSCPRQKRSPK